MMHILGTENVVAVAGYLGDSCIVEYESDDPRAVEMVEEGYFPTYRVECACGCLHYIKADGADKWRKSEYCQDHSYMHE